MIGINTSGSMNVFEAFFVQNVYCFYMVRLVDTTLSI